MPLFVVERDLSQVPPERLRVELKGLLAACRRLQGLGKRVRYISSAVFPSEARGLCLFGAEEPQWIREVNEAARLPYSRIFPVLDLTPVGVPREVSCGRRPLSGPDVRARVGEPAEGVGTPGGSARVSAEVARWSDEGRQLVQALGGWLEEAARIQGDAAVLESERAAAAAEARRLEEENGALRAQRDDLLEALQTLAGQMTRTADEILYRFGGRREAPGDLAPR
jgi:Nickel responsive protein SCO4226-like